MQRADVKFDKAEQIMESGTVVTHDWEQFWKLPLMERITNLSAGKFKFSLNGELVRPKEAVTR